MQNVRKSIRYLLIMALVLVPFAVIATIVRYNMGQAITVIPVQDVRVSEVQNGQPINSRTLTVAQRSEILEWLRLNEDGWKLQFGKPTFGVLAISFSHRTAPTSVLHLMPGFAVFVTDEATHFRKLTDAQYAALLTVLGYRAS
jgi:hypothetical protein